MKQPKFCIQKEYRGREKHAVMFYCNKHDITPLYSDTPIPGYIPVGSVEFVELLIGKQTPNYYPSWCKKYLKRDISEAPLPFPCFVKPKKGYKQYEAYVCETANNVLDTENVIYSEILKFTDEWRLYVSNGKILCSWWYTGNDQTCETHPHAPEMDISIPKDFCGTIDVGKTNKGMALVECHLPYAIGWYGEINQPEKYVQFLVDGFKFLEKNVIKIK